ncbi:hypothetical protein ACFPZ0_14210 [Streptomonospora nanhaiensis]|uniref:Uncharacterized protein n=1 Tax=Streptomonospora nanhaiensis TaxID=1323731 RepID=A0A853BHQ8_9ACTN|nr:hypothetical protein [Streptomonospora nanhaiensis]MBV2362327.1 hypothetical protein [Streptomonospora nanhaiensis]MBX9388197.1 hypothetical protein [Streptomonospora nanhaiensis]NYI95018.1 hypothetical protein [Streptomonospora nanhaiensis]
MNVAALLVGPAVPGPPPPGLVLPVLVEVSAQTAAWFWSGLGVLVGAAIAAAVIRHRYRQ